MRIFFTSGRIIDGRGGVIERADPIIPRHIESFRMALAKGLKIAMGCDCGAPSRFPNGENALEFWLMVRYGMDPMQAIVAGTSNAATLLRRDRWVGAIEPGQLADLIVIDGNPLDDITALQHLHEAQLLCNPASSGWCSHAFRDRRALHGLRGARFLLTQMR
jgi:predicted amidohydrolase YtcJ